MRHRHDAGCRVQRNDRNEVRMDTMGALLMVQLCDLPFSHDHATHAGADDDADSVRILPGYLKTRIGQRFFGSDESELRVTIYPFGLNPVDVLFRREPMDLAGHFGSVSIHW